MQSRDTGHMPLSLRQKLSYGVGHVLNDLCASIWFSYLLIYLHSVVTFSNRMAGNLMLIGQVSDALCTPFIGYESDRTNGFCGYGKRKSWHLIGTICVACSFPFLFIQCLPCQDNTSDIAKFIYYAPFVVIFQFGWASTQISHLSLIPDLTDNEGERVFLNALRYAFTVISNLIVYVTAWLLLEFNEHHASKATPDAPCNGTTSSCPLSTNAVDSIGSKYMSGNATDGEEGEDLSTADGPSFRNLAIMVVCLGLMFSGIFHIGTKEKSKKDIHGAGNKDHCDDQTEKTPLIGSNSSVNTKKTMSWSCWLKDTQFYLIAILYMATRLVVNLSQVYLPFYLTDTLDLRKQTIAYIPLAGYIVGLLTSFVMKPFNNKFGRKPTYLIGLALVIGCNVLVFFIKQHTSYKEMFAFAASILIGAGGTTLLITSLAFVSDLVSHNTESGAFVYGAMSFTDKLSNGVAIMVIQQLHPCTGVVCCPACAPFYRHVLSLVPGGCALLAALILIILIPQKIGHRPCDLLAENSDDSFPCAASSLSINTDDERDVKMMNNCASSIHVAS